MHSLHILNCFTVIEGLDGSGTTTQLNLLGQKFEENKVDVFKTKEPTGNPIGLLIRDVLGKKIALNPQTLAYLFVSDRNEHLYGKNGILENAEKGKWIISDRYLFSSVAYQSLSCNRDWIIELNKFPLPQFLFFIDVPPEVCSRRIKKRSADVELFDNIEIQNKILENYNYSFEKLSAQGMNFYRIDGQKNAEDICEEIWNIINPYL